MARGGRPKGTPNKPTAALEKSLQRRFGDSFNVMHMMAEQALALHEEASKPGGDRTAKRVASVNAWAKVAPYVYPALKAVEVDVTSQGEAIAPTEIILRVADDSGNGRAA